MTEQIKTADLPREAQDFLQGVYDRTRIRLERLIQRHGMKPGLSAALATERIAALDSEMRPVFPALEQAGTPVACAKGCAFCCTLTIDVTPDEAFALVDYLERTQPPKTVEAIKARAAAADARGHGMEPLARHRLQLDCPVLDPETRTCLGHAARPAPCQGYLSLDLKRCEAVHAGTGQDVPQPVAANMVTNVISHTRSYALEDAGAPRQSLELTAALLAAWADRGAEARWLSGEDVLPQASSYVPET